MLTVAGIALSVTHGVAAQQATQPSSPGPGSPDFYTQRIEPIFDDNCYSCHAESQSGGLRLDSYPSILKGGGRGPVIVPGDPDTSLAITFQIVFSSTSILAWSSRSR